MRTVTLELPDELFEFATSEADRNGLSLDATIATLLKEIWRERQVEAALRESESSPVRPWREALSEARRRFEEDRLSA